MFWCRRGGTAIARVHLQRLMRPLALRVTKPTDLRRESAYKLL